ncbi:MAG: hypothetical protein INQ03_24225 [Candidatus Heimdallarchaeota archaeon]|nr:hypothetical protein [Candidatus Heimdallarchaeota archaeon]
MQNEVLDKIFKHRSVRRFDPEFEIPENDIQLIIKAGQQASTSCSGQMYSIIEISKDNRHQVCGKQTFINQASWFGIICVDLYRLHRLVETTGAENPQWPLSGLVIGTFDAGLMAQNMALAAESLGYDLVFCGTCGDKGVANVDVLKLPEMVYPLTGIALGKGTENPPTRPRLPTELIYHRDTYKVYDKDELENGIRVMNDKLTEEGYYKKYSKLDNYSWREHINRKFGGKWLEDIEKLRREGLKHQKFLDE